jgi:hypothetical protein
VFVFVKHQADIKRTVKMMVTSLGPNLVERHKPADTAECQNSLPAWNKFDGTSTTHLTLISVRDFQNLVGKSKEVRIWRTLSFSPFPSPSGPGSCELDPKGFSPLSALVNIRVLVCRTHNNISSGPIKARTLIAFWSLAMPR